MDRFEHIRSPLVGVNYLVRSASIILAGSGVVI
jgi:hypothetical protein